MSAGKPIRERVQEIVADRQRSATERLHALFAEAWAWEMREFPDRATWNGWKGEDHRWCDRSRAAIERRRGELGAIDAAARQLPRGELAAAEQLHLDLFLREFGDAVTEAKYPAECFAITQMDGIHQDPVQLMAVAPAETTKEREDALARLEALPRLFEQSTELLRHGLSLGVTPPRITLRDVPQQIDNLCVAEPLESPLLAAFAGADPKQADPKLTAAAREVFTQKIVPALRELRRFVVEHYLPGCRETTGWRDLPDGEAWYAFKVREQTTTDLTPREIHELGLEEVKRIRALMDATIRDAGFPADSEADFAAWCHFLRSDRRFYCSSADELLREYRDLCKRIDPQLPKLFGRLPRLPYGVIEVPAFSAESQTTAYYLPGSPEGARPGWFYANTSLLDSRPRWEMEALTLHEAVPGHHLQLALAQELDLPEFRRHAGHNAYIEGWALYAESLGDELGCYRDPWSRFGQLSFEMWRAIRLVVDTGLHAFGWSRQRAIDWFAANTGKPLHDITVEVDRYLVWPAQALSYKIGELEIRKLRRAAERELGSHFDRRAFHDELLGQGALPLDLLTRRLHAWIDALAQARRKERSP